MNTDFIYNWIPAKHIKPIAINPINIMVIPRPRSDFGIIEYSRFLRMTAIARVPPFSSKYFRTPFCAHSNNSLNFYY